MNGRVKRIGEFRFKAQTRLDFQKPSFRRAWARKYPLIFDEDDLRITQIQAKRGYHFFEWLGAITIYKEFGYLSLIEKYQFTKHKRKHWIFEHLVPRKVRHVFEKEEHKGKVQYPDLLVYKPDFSDWFFCEVKGGADRMRPPQEKFFADLTRASGKRVRLIEFKEARGK